MVRDKITGEVYDIFYPSEHIKVLYCRATKKFLHVTKKELDGPLFEQVHVEEAKGLGLLGFDPYGKEDT